MSGLRNILAPYTDRIQTDTAPGNPFRLESRLEAPAAAGEWLTAFGDASLPPGVAELWSVLRSGVLFRDADYGQWGLRVLSPTDAAARTRHERISRPLDIGPGDVVLGEFLGDQDLLVVESGGAVLIGLPLDSRADWYRAASGVADFFDRYVGAKGDKYWERSAGPAAG